MKERLCAISNFGVKIGGNLGELTHPYMGKCTDKEQPVYSLQLGWPMSGAGHETTHQRQCI